MKLLRQLGEPIPEGPPRRGYAGHRPEAKSAVWCLHAPIGRIARGMTLIIALPRAATIHWGVNGWQNIGDGETQATGLGLHG